MVFFQLNIKIVILLQSKWKKTYILPRADPVTNATLFLRFVIFASHNPQLNNVVPHDHRVDRKKPLIAGLARSVRRCLEDQYLSYGLNLRSTARLKLQFSGHSPSDSRQIEERRSSDRRHPAVTAATLIWSLIKPKA